MVTALSRTTTLRVAAPEGDAPSRRPPTAPWRGLGHRARRGEAGYNMVVLMVAVTVLTVFTAAALPMWSQAAQREKEEELISRGWQYAEAIRVFQQRHGRYPTRLEELIEVEPRSIRKLWKDPMTESGKWGLVFQGGVAPPGQGGGRELGGGGGPGDGREGRGRRPGQGDRGTPRPGEQRTVGPIVGVRSLSDEESVKILFGEEIYDAWQFTVDRLGGGQVTGIGPEGVQRGSGPPQPLTGPDGRPILPKAEWLGRPFRQGLQVPAGGAGAGGPGVAGQPNPRGGDPGRPRSGGRTSADPR